MLINELCSRTAHKVLYCIPTLRQYFHSVGKWSPLHWFYLRLRKQGKWSPLCRICCSLPVSQQIKWVDRDAGSAVSAKMLRIISPLRTCINFADLNLRSQQSVEKHFISQLIAVHQTPSTSSRHCITAFKNLCHRCLLNSKKQYLLGDNKLNIHVVSNLTLKQWVHVNVYRVFVLQNC